MRNSILISLLIVLVCSGYHSHAQDEGKVLARIYTGFYHDFDNTLERQSAFDFTTGIIGYTRKLGEKVKATLLYDVTRTTHFDGLETFPGSFEGSKYTAFLKMGQIDWTIHPGFTLSVGQLLNQQYLTVQDKWWGFRYVAVTFQEKYRYGMPADFGARFTYGTADEKLKWSLSAVNGEGPFRYQDDNSKFLLSTNVEYFPLKNFLVKLYVDWENPSEETHENSDRNVVSGFLGYKTEKLMTGCELNYVTNYGFVKGLNYRGYSFYGSYLLFDKVSALARLDYGNLMSHEDEFYAIFGGQYEPVKNYFVSLNFRMYKFDPAKYHGNRLNVNFAAKF
jgi:hypothetical protein